MQPSDLDDLSSRPLRAIHADGISELVMGLTWLLWGSLIGLPQIMPRGAWWTPYWIVVPLLLVSSGFASQWAIKRLKERWTYRRGGYVQPNPPTHGKLWAIPLITMVSAAVVAGFLTGNRGYLDLMPLGCSVLVAAGLAFGLGRQGVPGAAFYAVLSIAIGFVIVRQQTNIELGFAFLWGGLGLAMTIGGLWRLWRFVRSHAEVQPNV